MPNVFDSTSSRRMFWAVPSSILLSKAALGKEAMGACRVLVYDEALFGGFRADDEAFHFSCRFSEIKYSQLIVSKVLWILRDTHEEFRLRSFVPNGFQMVSSWFIDITEPAIIFKDIPVGPIRGAVVIRVV